MARPKGRKGRSAAPLGAPKLPLWPWLLVLGAVFPEFAVRHGSLVHLVRAVRESQCPGVRPERGEREVLADSSGAVRLDRLVQDPLGRPRHQDLDRLDLGVRALFPTVSISQAVLS